MALLIAVGAFALLGVPGVDALPARIGEAPPPVPECFYHDTNGVPCDGLIFYKPSAVVKVTVADKNGVFTLNGPAPLQYTKPVMCGEACVYNHLNWSISGPLVVSGCQVNDSTCRIRLSPGGTGWFPVLVQQNNDYPVLFLVWNSGKVGFTLSGTIRATCSGATCKGSPPGVPGIEVNASGDGGGTGFTDAKGAYSMVLPEGTYVVTPPSGDRPFTPKSQRVELTGDKGGVDFTTCPLAVGGHVNGPLRRTASAVETPATGPVCGNHMLSGYVKSTTDSPVPGVSVTAIDDAHPLDGAKGTATTDATGHYEMSLPAGTYRVQPRFVAHSPAPTSTAITCVVHPRTALPTRNTPYECALEVSVGAAPTSFTPTDYHQGASFRPANATADLTQSDAVKVFIAPTLPDASGTVDVGFEPKSAGDFAPPYGCELQDSHCTFWWAGDRGFWEASGDASPVTITGTFRSSSPSIADSKGAFTFALPFNVSKEDKILAKKLRSLFVLAAAGLGITAAYVPAAGVAGAPETLGGSVLLAGVTTKALVWMGGGAAATSEYYNQIGDDPFDPKYRSVFPVRAPAVVRVVRGHGVSAKLASAINALDGAEARLIGYAQAASVTVNRVGSAQAKGNLAEARVQDRALASEEIAMARLDAQLPGLVTRIAQATTTNRAFGRPLKIPRAFLAKQRAKLRHGLPTSQTAIFTKVHLTSVKPTSAQLARLTPASVGGTVISILKRHAAQLAAQAPLLRKLAAERLAIVETH